MSECSISGPLERRYTFEDSATFVEDSLITKSCLACDSLLNHVLPYVESLESTSASSSTLPEFSSSPGWSQSHPSVHLVSVMSSLIGDLEAMSNDLSEIKHDIKTLGLPKLPLGIPATPRFIYTPPTPEVDDNQQQLIELEDWEIQQKLNDMVLEVGFMYLDIVEMAEEGFFPDGIPKFLRSDELSQDDIDFMEGPPLEPEDVMRLLEQLAIPEMLDNEETDGEESYSSVIGHSYSSETTRQDEDLFEEDPSSTRMAQSWSADLDSCDSIDSIPTPSDSGEHLAHQNPPSKIDNDSIEELSIVDETFLQSFQIAVSPLSRLIHSHTPPGQRRRSSRRRIQMSPTILFAPAPVPQIRNSLDLSTSFHDPDSSLFSEPTPLLPFSVHMPSVSPSARDSTSRHSFWDKLKGIKRHKLPSVYTSSHANETLDLSPLKKFFASSAKSSTLADSSVGFIYDSTSVRGVGCLPSSR